MTFDPAVLAAFPAYTLPANATIFRIHGDHRHVWNFQRFDGRFAPSSAPDPVGACFLAEEPLGAFVEVFRVPTKAISAADITRRCVSELQVGRPLRLADLLSRKSLTFGTKSIDAEDDYTDAQAFASAASEVGFDGVRYYASHDPSKKLVAYALFGPSGSPDPADAMWPAGSKGPISDALVDLAADEFGYTVI